ncbi:MAG: hypothetical protein NZ958_02590 [Bacteroidia bacterium]|nr:hypothetical protein [Bacteroidia bacterium]MDW8089565.1 hypothetical protein [Bacteroidia bacterium]
MHLWARPAAALRYDRTFLHFSPFPPYLSLGVSHTVGYFQARERHDRPLYLALHGHWRYLPTRELRYDSRIITLVGVRLWLEPYLQRFYVQIGVGITFHHIRRRLWHVWPTGEVQIGGFYRPHRYVPKRLYHTRPY